MSGFYSVLWLPSEPTSGLALAARPAYNPHFPALRSDSMALSGASGRKQIPSNLVEKQPPKEILATRLGKLRSREMNLAVKSSESSDYWCGLRFFVVETPFTDGPKHLFRLLFPRNPHFPALWSDSRALSGASSRKQIPSDLVRRRRYWSVSRE